MAKDMESLEKIFHPQSIAVVGASEDETSNGFQYLRFLIDSNYSGRLYPVNPRRKNVLGLPAYVSLKEIPGNIDYVISCINANLVIDMLQQCAQKKVAAVHLFTAKLSETGNDNACHLEQAIKLEAQRLGIRLIGPNCMGIYHPGQRMTFNHELCMEPGSVGAIVQSGGLAGEIVRMATLRGVRFSKVVSYGNAVDLNETDFLEYLLWDKETKLILMYIEGTGNGRKLLQTLREVAKVKPVIILKGGRSRAGMKSAASHTASIAGSMNTWQVVFRQAKVIQANNLNELIDLAVAFYFLPPISGKRVGMVGGGGGKSVLASDEYEEAGLELAPMPEEVVQFLESKSPGISGWLGNPVDASILASINIKTVEMLKIMSRSPAFDLLSINASEDSLFNGNLWIQFIEGEVHGCLMIQKERLKPVVFVINNPEMGIANLENWRWQALFRLREQLINEGIPVFSSPGRAATAINKLIDYYSYLEQ